MKRSESSSLMQRWTVVFLFMLSSVMITIGQTPVGENGALRITGNKVVNKNNLPVSFSGPSHFWSNTGWGGERYYNAAVVNYFSSNWNAGIIRAAMGVDEDGGYFSDPSNKARVKAVVDAAIAAGMYVIIDWHTHHAEDYRPQAISFFQEMAQTYGTYPNVIYEIYNEPLNVSWSGTIKPYANAVISAIRAIDPDNIIVVGTPNWSQDVDAAANDPITGYSNIAYTLHFYAATHKSGLRSKASTALSRGLALFVTEWGTCEASGNGFVDEASTNEWVAFMKENGISNCNWSINDKLESASILNAGTPATGNWTDANLTPSGKLVKRIVSGWNGSSPPSCAVFNVPGTLQAENFCSMSGIQVESTGDAGGGQNVGWIESGDWMAYRVNVPSTDTYRIEYRVASQSGGGSIRLEAQGGSPVYGTIGVPSTGGWQNWTTVSHEVQLSAGEQNIAIAAVTGGFNINWISLNPVNAGFTVTVQAEDYSEMSGVQKETTADSGGGLNVGYIDNNDWMKYSRITIPQTGTYVFEYRVASPYGTGILSQDLNSGAIQLGTISVPNTGGWQNWRIISRRVTLEAGTYDFGIFAASGRWNINWWRLTLDASTGASQNIAIGEENLFDFKVYPNPSRGNVVIRVSEPSQVTLVSMNGKTFFKGDVSTHKAIDQIPSGVYVVKVRTESRVKTTKLIVQ